MLTSCEKPKSVAEQLAGDWHCTSSAIDAEIYVTFTAEKTFILYQQIGEGSYRVYNGTWSIDGTTLRGQYNDGSSWATSYEVASTDDNTLSLTAEGITETYSRVSGGIPEEVLASCVTVVKSKGVETVAFL